MSRPKQNNYKPTHTPRATAAPRRPRTLDRGHPTTADVDYAPKEMEFMQAMQEFKRVSGHQFPTWCEVLSVIESLGYHRT